MIHIWITTTTKSNRSKIVIRSFSSLFFLVFPNSCKREKNVEWPSKYTDYIQFVFRKHPLCLWSEQKYSTHNRGDRYKKIIKFKSLKHSLRLMFQMGYRFNKLWYYKIWHSQLKCLTTISPDTESSIILYLFLYVMQIIFTTSITVHTVHV